MILSDLVWHFHFDYYNLEKKNELIIGRWRYDLKRSTLQIKERNRKVRKEFTTVFFFHHDFPLFNTGIHTRYFV